MAMNTNNIKDFERIQTSIQKSRAECAVYRAQRSLFRF